MSMDNQNKTYREEEGPTAVRPSSIMETELNKFAESLNYYLDNVLRLRQLNGELLPTDIDAALKDCQDKESEPYSVAEKLAVLNSKFHDINTEFSVEVNRLREFV